MTDETLDVADVTIRRTSTNSVEIVHDGSTKGRITVAGLCDAAALDDRTLSLLGGVERAGGGLDQEAVIEFAKAQADSDEYHS